MLTAQGVHAFSDNYIWLIKQPEKPYIAIVDPGDAAPVIETIESQSLQPVALLITHHHWDHTVESLTCLNAIQCPYTAPTTSPYPT